MDNSSKRRYLHYFVKDIVDNKILENRLGIKQSNHKMIGGRTFPDLDTTNQMIYDAIASGNPFSLVRPGNGEFSFVLIREEIFLFKRMLYVRKGENYDRFMKMFKDDADEYRSLFLRDISDADIFGAFPGATLEEYLAERYANEAKWINAWNMTPIQAKRPWTDALEGKKVLVVSQFSDYLLSQYDKRNLLYGGEWMWPDFELIPVKSVFYFDRSKRFNTWFDALNYLYEEIMTYDFDIAILSCGPFAINLASMIKRSGKQAIQYAGELQMLFGIKGARWDDSLLFSKYFNDEWIRVSKKEIGISEEDSKNMDFGKCYW